MAILETLRALKTDERDEFRDFLRSPFCTRSVRNHKPENLAALLDFLFENSIAGEDESFDKAQLYAQLFPGKKFSEATVNALASELHRLLKEYLKTKTASEKNEAAALLDLALAYQKRGLDRDFWKTIEAMKRALDETPAPERDVEFYIARFLADYEICTAASKRNTKSDDAHLNELLASLDVFYGYTKILHGASLIQQRNIVAFDAGELLPLTRIMELVAQSPGMEIPAVRCFQKAIETMMASGEDEMAAQFADYQALVHRHENAIPPHRLYGLHAIERSICSRLYVAGRSDMLPVLFDLYKRHLAAGWLYEWGLNHAIFQNIVRAGLKLGEFDWVERFLAEHTAEHIVFCQYPEDVHRFNLASFYFHKKDYARTLQCLQQRYEDNYYLLDANLLELKLYYERRNWSLLDNKLNSFKVNIFKKSKQWLPAARFEAINRFVDLLRQLTHDRIQMDRDPAAIARLRQKVLESVVAEREWLLEKLENVAA